MRRWLVMAVVCAWATAARGQEDEKRTELRQALLREALTGDYAEAIRTYERLAREEALESQVRAEALYRLGAARYAIGNMKQAREALLEGTRRGSCGPPCHLLLERIQLEEDSIRTVPVHWGFDSPGGNPVHGFSHPYEFDNRGSIRVQSPEEAANPALIWSTLVDVRQSDQLVVGFDRPSPPPKRVAFRIQAAERDAVIRVRFVDDLGRFYAPHTDTFRVPTARPAPVVLHIADLEPLDPEAPPLSAGALHRLYLDDVSALTGTAPGPNALYIDDFVVE